MIKGTVIGSGLGILGALLSKGIAKAKVITKNTEAEAIEDMEIIDTSEFLIINIEQSR